MSMANSFSCFAICLCILFVILISGCSTQNCRGHRVCGSLLQWPLGMNTPQMWTFRKVFSSASGVTSAPDSGLIGRRGAYSDVLIQPHSTDLDNALWGRNANCSLDWPSASFYDSPFFFFGTYMVHCPGFTSPKNQFGVFFFFLSINAVVLY